MRRAILGAVLVVIAVVACTTVLAYYYWPSRNIASSTTIVSTTAREASHVSGYYISVYYGNKLIKKLTLSDLHKLRNYAFVDSRGHEQEGPLLYDVIKYVIGNKTFKYVIVKGQQGNREENLTYAIVSNPKNYLILDYTKKWGTVKLCGNGNVLPYSKWVKNVTEIIIKG
ncbi:MAG: hypothetical protein G5Z42_01120 [Caldisphaeraceae archaeon]|nr:hypothetical protein [Caldisphaeraceae archaeon]MEB3797405.1 hypothetical protein [Caldisphaeraceae archaeon]